MSDYELTIDLSELQSNETLSPEKLIFRPQYDTLLSLVKETLRANLEHVEQERKEKGNDADLTIIKRNPCFFIDGPRGSGKSTFLRTVRHELLNPPSGAFEYKLNSLCEVDPSELAPGEDFFLLILSRLCHLLEQKQRVRDMRENANYKKAVELLQKMSEGIKILATGKDGISRALESENFLEESVEQCNSSTELKKHFAELMEKVCQICGVQALLVTIDDADMGFDKCFKILEYVRIYMRCPHIIFIFTGDMKQYSLVVRGNLLRYFGEYATKNDETCRRRRENLLEELTNQYLFKVFSIRNKVSLPSPIKLILESEHVKIEPIGKWAELEPEAKRVRQGRTFPRLDPSLNRFIERTIRRYCGAGNFNALFDLLGVMPLRMLMQFFQHLGLESQNKKNGRSVYYNAVYSVSRNYLIENEVEDSLIRAGNVISLMKAVLTYIAYFDFSKESSRLLIPEAQFAKKMEALYLSAEIMNMINNSRWLIAYMCIVFPYCEGYKLRKAEKHQTVEHIRKEIADSLNNFGFRARCCNSTAHIAYSLRKSSNPKHSDMGVIILKGNTKNSKHGTFYKYVENLLEQPFNAQKGLFILAVYFSLSKIEGEKGTCYCLSIFNLFSSLVYLMVNSVGQSRTAIEEFVKSEFVPGLFMMESPLKHDVDLDPSDVLETAEVDAVNYLFFNWEQNLSQDKKDAILTPICDWAEKFEDCRVLCTPSLLANVWDFFKLQCSLKRNRNSENSVLDSFKLYDDYLLAFLNALGIFKEIKEKTLDVIKEFPLFKAISDAKNIIANSSPTKKQSRDAIADSAQKPTLESLNEELQTAVKERDALKATLAQHRKGKVVSANPVWRQYKGDVSAMNNALADLNRKVTSLRDKIRRRERKVK